MTFRFQLIVTISFLIIYACQPAQDSPNNEGQLARLKEELKNPPTSARPKGFWSGINGNGGTIRPGEDSDLPKIN